MGRKTSTHEIEFKGSTLEVTGNYYKGSYQTYEYPGDPEEFEIDTITINGIEQDYFEEDLYEIEYLIIEKFYR